MKKLLLIIGALLFATPVYSQTVINQFQPGPRLINGTHLNKIVDLLNSKKIVRGETALDGTNPTPVATGLTTIASCDVSIKLATAPGVGTSVATYGTSGATLNLYGWKVTSSSDNTLIASTGTETIGWICVGS